MLIKSITKFVFVIAWLCPHASGQVRHIERAGNQNTVAEIKKLEQERFNAYVKLDVATLERIMADDYTSIYADGEVITRAEELKSMRSAPPNVLSSLKANIDQIAVRQFGFSAVLTGRLIINGTVDWFEKDVKVDASFRYTAIYINKLGRWRIVACQFTTIEPPDK
ncbi:MAG: nuclear transport factor 2 family protein [Pyrinomonadaceae bacterium]